MPARYFDVPASWIAVVFAIGCGLGPLSGKAMALDGSKSLLQYAHRIWGQEEGLFQPTVYSIRQTRDGVLWLGTQDSLIRFDGLHFRELDDSPQAPLHRSLVRDLAEDREGNLWVGSIGSGVLRVSPGGRSRHYTVQDGLPSNDVFSVNVGSNGELWVCTNRGLARFDGQFFHTYSAADGLPSAAVRSTCLAKDGTRWVSGLDFPLARSIGEKFQAFQISAMSDQTGVSALLCGSDGAVWAGTASGLLRISPQHLQLISTAQGLPDNAILSLHESRDGNLWIGTDGGISRWHNGDLSVYRTRDGLSHSSVLSLYEDREGTLWAGTKDGLDQFTDGKVTPYTRHEGLSWDDIGPVLQDREGRLWIGTIGHGLNLYDHSRFRTLTSADGLTDNTILSLELDNAGDLWIGTKHGLNRCHDGKIQGAFTRKNGLSGNEIRTLFSDVSGTLWVGTENGLDHWSGAGFVHCNSMLSEEPTGGVLALGSGRTSNLIVSTGTQGMYAFRNGIATHSSTDLSRPVDCYFIDKEKGETWMGTLGSGLLRYRNGTITHVRVKDGLYDNRIYSIVRDDHANLWLASSKGIFRVSRQQLDDFAEGRVSSVTSIPFSTGQLRFECQSGVQPAATRTHDGRLWFATTAGLVMIDPNHMPVNQVAPPVAITGVFINGRPVERNLSKQLQLNNSERNIEVRYAGLSFVSPERVAFRYMLKGYENSWTNAGSRREAFFTNLPPGPFEFQVSARSADGMWSVQPASFRFYVKPRFFQRVWFLPSALGLLVLTSLFIYRLRVASLRNNFSLVLGERSRIARELHDTLLQGISGITMQLQALWSAMPASREKAVLLAIIDDAGRCARDARRSLWGLRSSGSDSAGFTEKLAKAARQVVGKQCQLRLQLQPVSLADRPEIEYQLLRIATEAMLNAVRHARACSVCISLVMQDEELQLTVQDDGIGFEQKVQPFAHYGLTGIRERAEEIGADLQITSAAGKGTTVSLLLKVNGPESPLKNDAEPQMSHHTA